MTEQIVDGSHRVLDEGLLIEDQPPEKRMRIVTARRDGGFDDPTSLVPADLGLDSQPKLRRSLATEHNFSRRGEPSEVVSEEREVSLGNDVRHRPFEWTRRRFDREIEPPLVLRNDGMWVSDYAESAAASPLEQEKDDGPSPVTNARSPNRVPGAPLPILAERDVGTAGSAIRATSRSREQRRHSS